MELFRWQHGRVRLVPAQRARLSTCGICREPASDARALENCRHVFCGACLATYVRLKLQRGNVYPLCCWDEAADDPARAARICGAEIAPTDVMRALPPALRARYERLKLQRDHRDARECPFCQHVQVFAQASAAAPACACAACGRAFCFVHSAAHGPDETCGAFERALATREAPSRAAVARIARPCPSCGSDIEKVGGCDRMLCAACSVTFCWPCGAALDDATAMRVHRCQALESDVSAAASGSLPRRSWRCLPWPRWPRVRQSSRSARE